MRVAIYTETFLPKIDGIVRVTCLTLEHLQRRRIDAVLIAPSHGQDDTHEYAGAPIIRVPAIRNPVYPEGRISFPNPSTYRQVKAFRPDLMHSFHPIVLGLSGLLFARRMQVPALSSFHLDMAKITNYYAAGLGKLVGRVLRRSTTWAFNQSTYTLAPSRLVQAEMKAQGIRRVGLWRRGVDAELFHPDHRSHEMRNLLSDGNPDDHLLLYVGRLAPEKQIYQIRAVLERVPHTRLALIGGGPAENALRKHFEGLPVKFAGYMTGTKLASAYASADLFVFPSAFESFGLVILEAMACGTPVISSRVGGAQDMIDEDVSGYTFDVDDIDTLVNSVRRAVAPGKLQQMRLAARQHAERQSWPAMMDELITCYEALVEGRPSPI